MIDVCALGPLRVTSAAYNQGNVAAGGKVIVISSQAGSAEWRKVQNQGAGGDYGHHMSRAACNIAAVRPPSGAARPPPTLAACIPM